MFELFEEMMEEIAYAIVDSWMFQFVFENETRFVICFTLFTVVWIWMIVTMIRQHHRLGKLERFIDSEYIDIPRAVRS